MGPALQRQDFDGWRQCNGTEMPKNWIIEDDAMKVFTGEGKNPGQGANGDILYDKIFKNFRTIHRLEGRRDGQLRDFL